MNEEKVDLRRYLDIFLRWWWLLLLGPIVAGVAAYLFSINEAPQYRAATLVLVQQRSGLSLPNAGDFQLSQILAPTYKEVFTTRPVLEAVIGELGYPSSASALRVRVSIIAGTSLLNIEATDPVPQQAAAISNTLAQQFIRLTEEKQLAEIARVQSALAAQGISNPEQILGAQLSALSSLVVVEPAVAPSRPVSPRVALNTLLGILFGGFVAVVGTLTLEYLNDTPRAPEEVERRTGLPRIATVPRWPTREVLPQEIVTLTHPRGSYAEAFRQARLNIQFLSRTAPPKRYMITSPGPRAGKSTFSVNLAVALVQEGKRVTLVDADLRRPSVHRYFSLDNPTGLSTFLANPHLDLSQVVRSTSIEGLSVITSGPTPPNPVELLNSPAMDALLDRLGQRGDIVVLDTPPIMAVTETAAMASKQVETILIVDPTTRLRALKDCQDTLAKANARILGFVLNRVQARRAGYGYYHYGYYSPDIHNKDQPPKAEGQGQNALARAWRRAKTICASPAGNTRKRD
ncbi:MAG: polysaccharide biosynthesis tyrosine autokinase [Dehalococcoidia bacterium]|nr:polysaccharide biosynthesis tyrosine autokinase [Dehalococcoidia bacterium]